MAQLTVKPCMSMFSKTNLIASIGKHFFYFVAVTFLGLLYKNFYSIKVLIIT